MSNTVISVENISKSYRLGQISGMTLAADLQAWWARRRGKPNPLLKIGQQDYANRQGETVWALRDVSFTVQQGEALGIIGRNGAGKSTLLKILSRVTAPTTGQIKVKGRIASLLEVGTGFHPELTGRENIYLNGAILGMSKIEVEHKLDEIIDFSGIETYIDTPVKRYSSGMYVRLAFAVAAHLDPEILIVDEVLAVGDAAFQKKCLGKMGDVAKEGRTVLFVSHNMAAIENLCSKSIFLQQGAIKLVGKTDKIISLYLKSVISNISSEINLADRKDRAGNQKIKFTSFHIEDKFGNILPRIKCGMDVKLIFGYFAKEKDISNIDVGFSFHTEHNQLLFVLYSSYIGKLFTIKENEGVFCCNLNNLPLAAGIYHVGARLVVGNVESDWPNDGIGFVEVEASDFFGTGSLGFNSQAAPILIKGDWN